MRAELLNNVQHQHLRLRTDVSAALGDAVVSVPTIPAEFRALQAHYPIVFQPSNDSAGFQPVAMLGLQEGQNLFLGPQGWEAHHLPYAIERQPLLVGRDGDEWLVHIDLDSPRLSETDGEPLFLPHGGQSELLERRIAVLQALHEGLQTLPAFIQALRHYELLEAMSLDIEQDDGTVRRLGGFYVIHEERFATLSAEAVTALHQAGYLLPITMAIASIGRFRDLIERARRQGR
ncbi:SapC family protein [Chitinimonas sp. BJYL2]|uniref:SapC family protein n=1 Tax=Chitinimonas sp. BJYL2 TaxID=2976696 RepID=UPI0022B3C6E3|nr:SapC family protein [Chitinimonas sp. BJYL2]